MDPMMGMSNTFKRYHYDTDEEEEEEEVAAILILMILERRSLHTKEPIKDGSRTGARWVREMLDGHVDRIYENFRMERHVFGNLITHMTERGWMKDTRYVRVDEQLGMFLSAVGCNKRFCQIAEDFQRSPETIGRIFTGVLDAFLLLAEENIRPPSFHSTPTEIVQNPKWYPFFTDCIGAIDRTHITAIVPVADQIPYRGRKGDTTQNVMAACSFDMKFTFVYTGWEGSANGCRVFYAVLKDPSLGFPQPPTGKYYVVDSGYPTMIGFLTPLKGQRYHLRDYRGRRASIAVELFNHRHSSVRNVIERCFGVLKKRFPILTRMPCFPLQVQSKIVIACCAIHNFIRDEQRADEEFTYFMSPHIQEDYRELEREDEVAPEPREDEEAPSIGQAGHDGQAGPNSQAGPSSQRDRARQMDELRKKIANEIARDRGLPQI